MSAVSIKAKALDDWQSDSFSFSPTDDVVAASYISAYGGGFEFPTWNGSSVTTDVTTEGHGPAETCGVTEFDPNRIMDHDHSEAYVTSGGKWGASSTFGTAGGTVTFSFAGSGYTNTTGQNFFSGTSVSLSSFMPADWATQIRSALSAWSAVANIDFVEVADGGGNAGVGTAGNIRFFGGYYDGSGDTAGDNDGNQLAWGFFPGSGTAGSSAWSGDISFDSGEAAGLWDSATLYNVAVHEIGHAIGLRHSDVGTAIMWPSINAGDGARSLDADDIAGVRAIYGTRSGGPGSVSINDVSITEGNSGTQLMTFTVTRTGGTAAFSVNYATANGTATSGFDYVATSGTLSFGTGVNTATFTVAITGDTTVEPNETFLVNLSGATNGATISDSQGVGTILNDDATTLADDFRDSFSDATAPFGFVSRNAPATGRLEVNGDTDWFAVNLTAGQTYTFREQALDSGFGTLADPYLRLHSTTGTYIAYNDDSGGTLDSLIRYTPASSGTYYLEAGGYNAGYTGTYQVSVALGGGFAPTQLAINTFGQSGSAGGWTDQDAYPRHAADINGDGRADIVGFGWSGVYVSLANTSGGFQPAFLAANTFGAAPSGGGWSSDNQYPRLMGDVNGDNRADIVGFGSTATYVALANANGTFQPAFQAIAGFGSSVAGGSWSSDNEYPREMGDVNGDGRADIVGFGSTGVYVALANANGTFQNPILGIAAFGSSPTAGGWSSDDTYPRLLGDVNGDNRDDIVAFGSTGVYVALANANGTFQNPFLASSSFGTSSSAGGWYSDDIYHRELADINRDGREDIVGFGDAGVFYSIANANGTFRPYVADIDLFGQSASGGGWVNNTTFPRVLADINNDQRADIIGFGGAGVYVSLATDFIA